MHYDHLILYFDGLSNKERFGPTSCGWALYTMDAVTKRKTLVADGHKYLGKEPCKSTAQAQYQGLCEGLAKLQRTSCGRLDIRSSAAALMESMEEGSPDDHIAQLLEEIQHDNHNFKAISSDANWKATKLAKDAMNGR